MFATIQDCERKVAWADLSVGLLTVNSEHSPLPPANGIDLQPVNTAIILEEGIVMDMLQNLPQALCLLLELSYSLHLSYPKSMHNTLNFVPVLGLGKDKLPPKQVPFDLLSIIIP